MLVYWAIYRLLLPQIATVLHEIQYSTLGLVGFYKYFSSLPILNCFNTNNYCISHRMVYSSSDCMSHYCMYFIWHAHTWQYMYSVHCLESILEFTALFGIDPYSCDFFSGRSGSGGYRGFVSVQLRHLHVIAEKNGREPFKISVHSYRRFLFTSRHGRSVIVLWFLRV